MADISTEIQAFEDAVYGEDVRQAIIDLAEKLNYDLEDAMGHEFVGVDNTLTMPGMGADAAVTGTELNKKADKVDPVFNGAISHYRKSGSTSGVASVAFGQDCTASGQGSFAEGEETVAKGTADHSEGIGTIANSDGLNPQHVQGRFNIEDTNHDYVHIVGNGSDNSHRSNSHTLDSSGNAWYAGDVKVGGSDYAHGSYLATEDYVDNAVPTKTSQLTNDAGFLKQHQDISGKQDKLTFDSTPTMNSTNPVTSGGVYSVLTGINTTLAGKANAADIPTKTSDLTNDSGFLTQHQDISGKQNVLTFDTTPTQNSTNPVTSNGIYDAIQDAVIGASQITIDSDLSTTSQNAVKNSVITSALANKANASDIPTKTSDLTNDSGFLTSHQSLAGYVTTQEMTTALAGKANASDVPTTTTGTFTPTFTPSAGSSGLTVRQVGNVVYISGMIGPNSGTIGDISGHHIGDISGVTLPSSIVYLPCLSINSNASQTHAGYLILSNGYVAESVDSTDSGIIVNAFYLV